MYDAMIIGNGTTTAADLNLIPLNTSKGAVFLGMANPDTIPGTPRQSVFYITGERGVYRGFGNIAINSGELAILLWDHGAWSKNILHADYAVNLDDSLNENSENPVTNRALTLKFRDLENMMIKGISINDVMLEAQNGIVNLTVDSELDGTSTNPIQNKAVHSKIAELDEWYEN